jgi:hypothetical protein
MNTVKVWLQWRNGRDWISALRTLVLLFFISQSAAIAQDASSYRRAAPVIGGTSGTAQDMVSWAVRSGDNQNLPFVIVDKIAARLFVFDANGTPRASTPVLLGLARGDHSVPGIGERPIADIRPAERTTPAGRFVGEPGKNIDGEDVIWIDYDAALSIHRVRPGPSRERRLERLASSAAADKRISYGCVVVPVRFYEEVITATFAKGKGIVYVLPEAESVEKVFRLAQD